MGRRRKDPLRPLTEQEQQALAQLARAGSEQADVVARAKEVLAVAAGRSYEEAAAAAGRRSYEAVSHLVTRFNQEGLAALQPHRGGGRKPSYDAAARERILAEARRPPDPQQDGTATWSLTTLQRALRSAPDGLPYVSTYTIFQVLHDAGFRWLEARSWCETGQSVRKRGNMRVLVRDRDAEAKKKINRARLSGRRATGAGGVDGR